MSVFEEQLQTVRESCYSGDFNFNDLKRHLLLLVDIIKQGTPNVKEVTSIHTICEAMNSQPVFEVNPPCSDCISQSLYHLQLRNEHFSTETSFDIFAGHNDRKMA